eukprot:COSAG06_NODE_4589_length_4122_cov_1.697241_2_plen_146_part_00
MGGGLNLALCCDVRYAADNAQFCVPPAKLGVGFPLQMMDTLVSAVGIPRAKELVYTARVLRAQEASDIGLVQAVAPAHALDEMVENMYTAPTQGLNIKWRDSWCRPALTEAYALEMEVCSEAESQMERYLRKSEASDLDEWAAID